MTETSQLRPRRVYVSFLGTGNYSSVAYQWQGADLAETPYAQEAELAGVLCSRRPDLVLMFGTKRSCSFHWERQHNYDPCTKLTSAVGEGLLPRLRKLGYEPEFVEISQTLSPADQWGTFELLLKWIQNGDELIFDMTHGFRAVPVVFSSAMHFLRLTRSITLRHVFYGAHDTKPPEIVDYAEFYAVQDWTEAVSRLVDDADASRLAALASARGPLNLLGSSSTALARSLAELTAAIRDVDLQQVGTIANAALMTIREAESQTTGAGKVLLQLVQDKFAALATVEPSSGLYDAAYFAVQRRLIGLLLEHGLAMQAYTAMSEYLASLGLHVASGQSHRALLGKDTGAKASRNRADVFAAMIAVNPRKDAWVFDEKYQVFQQELLPWYQRLERKELVKPLRELSSAIKATRNGFNHGWTAAQRDGKKVVAGGLRKLGKLERLSLIVDSLDDEAAEAAGGTRVESEGVAL